MTIHAYCPKAKFWPSTTTYILVGGPFGLFFNSRCPPKFEMTTVPWERVTIRWLASLGVMLQVYSFKDTRLKIKITENAENHDSSLVFKAVAVAKKRSKKTCGNSSDFFVIICYL